MKRYMVILNEKAGTCGEQADLETRVREAMGHRNKVTIVRPQGPEDALGLAERAKVGQFDAVVAIGGDGTHHWLLDALESTGIPLGLVPMGTANDLAARFDVPRNLEEACQVIRAGATTHVDLVHTHNKAFATVGGLGLATDIALGVCKARQKWAWFAWLMRRLGDRIYTLYMVLTVLFGRKLGYTYEVTGADGETRLIDGYMALIFNQDQLGGNFRGVPGADNQDGAFDVLLVKKAQGWFPRLKLLHTLTLSLAAKHIGRPDVETFRAKRLALATPEPVAFFADGEPVAESDRFEFTVKRRALKLCVPLQHADAMRFPSPVLGSSSTSGSWAA